MTRWSGLRRGAAVRPIIGAMHDPPARRIRRLGALPRRRRSSPCSSTPRVDRRERGAADRRDAAAGRRSGLDRTRSSSTERRATARAGCSSSSRPAGSGSSRTASLLPTPFLDISDIGLRRRRAGPPRARVPPELRDQRQFYVDFTRARRRHGDQRVQGVVGEPGRRRPTTGAADPDDRTSRTRTTTAAMLAFGPGRLPVHRDGRRRRRRRSGNRAQNVNSLLGKMLRIDVNGTTGGAAVPDPGRRTRTSAGPGATRSGRAACATRGAARSTGDRRPVDRRRRPGPVRGDRPRRPRPAPAAGAASTTAGASMEGRHCYIPSTGCNTPARRCRSSSTRTRAGLRGHRRLRLSRDGRPGPRRPLRVRRLLLRARSGRSRRGRACAERQVLLMDTRLQHQLVRRGRGTASCTSSTSAGGASIKFASVLRGRTTP